MIYQLLKNQLLLFYQLIAQQNLLRVIQLLSYEYQFNNLLGLQAKQSLMGTCTCYHERKPQNANNQSMDKKETHKVNLQKQNFQSPLLQQKNGASNKISLPKQIVFVKDFPQKYIFSSQQYTIKSAYIKYVQQNSKHFILKYITGDRKMLNQVMTLLKSNEKILFLYVVPILKIYDFSEKNQIVIKMKEYQKTISNYEQLKQYTRGEKLLIMYRLAKAVKSVQSRDIFHDKIQSDNIFLQSTIPYLGLPKCNKSATQIIDPKNSRQNPRFIHSKSLAQVFLELWLQKPLKQQIDKQKILISKLEDQKLKQVLYLMIDQQKGGMRATEIMQRLFQIKFYDINKIIPAKQQKVLQYESGTKYEGQCNVKNQKEGYGVETETNGNRYWGNWIQDSKHGRGSYQFKNGDYYCGDWKDNVRQGHGIEVFMEMCCYYEGTFRNRKKEGRGIWQALNGETYIGQWKDNVKSGTGVYYDRFNEWLYDGQWQNDSKNGKGIEKYISGTYYEGQFKNNLKKGQGYYRSAEGLQYRGQFVDNVIQGYGRYDYTNGNIYEGGIKNGQYHGKGKFVQDDQNYYDGGWNMGKKYMDGVQVIDGAKYQGHFVNNLREGKGKLTRGKSVYEGEFVKGKISGEGKYKYENGDVYEGMFLNNAKQGHGKYFSLENGWAYDGSWSEDKHHGKGKYSFGDAGFYEGDWVNSKREGDGTQFINETNKYMGHWVNDKKQGKGIQYEGNGNRYQGLFVNGLKQGLGKLYYSNGDRYQGQFIYNKSQGYGIYYYANEDRYEGKWVNDSRHGQGKLVSSKGVYDGEWTNNKREGYGRQFLANGQKLFQGQYVNDQKHGKGIFYMGSHRYQGIWKNDKRNGPGIFYDPDGNSEARQYNNDRQINIDFHA